MPQLLIAYDGGPAGEAAVRTAASLFPGAHAWVATVPPDPAVRVASAVAALASVSPIAVEQTYASLEEESRRQAGETAAHAVEQARALGLDAEAADLRPGGPAWAVLVHAAHRLAADVLVCGTRGRGVFARSLLGSTSTQLLHQADVPLLVVPDSEATADGPVVVAYDGSPGAEHALEVAGSVFGAHAAVVVHAWEPVFRRGLVADALAAGVVDDVHETVTGLHDAVPAGAAATADQGAALARAAGLAATGESVEAEDGAWRAVAAAARARDAAAIVIGTRGLGAARSVLLGSVSSGLVQNAERPVLVVPAAVIP